MKAALPRGLYAVTDGPRDDLADVVQAVLHGGARVVQYRDETDDTARRRSEALALKKLCDASGALLLIDNDIALAQQVQAAGVHLSRDPVAIGAARAALGDDALIGVSCYASMERARQAVSEGADYISFGAFFPSTTRPDAGHAPVELLRTSAALGVPRVAIGGISADNAGLLVDAGADCIAVVAALFKSDNPRQAAEQLARFYL